MTDCRQMARTVRGVADALSVFPEAEFSRRRGQFSYPAYGNTLYAVFAVEFLHAPDFPSICASFPESAPTGGRPPSRQHRIAFLGSAAVGKKIVERPRKGASCPDPAFHRDCGEIVRNGEEFSRLPVFHRGSFLFPPGEVEKQEGTKSPRNRPHWNMRRIFLHMGCMMSANRCDCRAFSRTHWRGYRRGYTRRASADRRGSETGADTLAGAAPERAH